jgi:TonB-linked SusC/RagA family outer membrane protein
MRKLIVTLIAVFVFIFNAAAQDRTITGTVTNEKGKPVEGVSVISNDGKQGTQTDAAGKYTLTVPSSIRSLVFSFVNFETQTKSIGKSSNLNVSIRPSDSKLEEIVVVGYGTQQKKAFTGSASKVDTKEFSQLVMPSIDKQLQGRASGVDVVNSGGLVNTPAKIRIRGYNTISIGANPLFVVDGIQITTGNLALQTNSNAIGDINPDDIETIDVLKDGSALAIYGSKGANGVIVITTKKGSKNKTSINYSATLGLSSPSQLFDVLDATRFVTIANEKFTNANQAGPARMDVLGTNTNWQNNVFVQSAFVQTHTLSMSGGTNKSTYYFSINYSDNQGVIRTNHNRDFRVRANLEQEANKYFKFGNNVSLSRQEDKDQNGGSNALSGAVVAALRDLPNVAILNAATPTGYNITGNALGIGNNLRTIDDNYVNIAFVLDKNKFYSDKYRIIDNAFLDIMPLKGLTIRTQLGIDYFNDNSFLSYDPRHGDGFSSNGVVYNGSQSILQTTVQEYFNYNKTYRRHNFFLTGGYELQQSTQRIFSAQGQNVADLFFIKESIIGGSVGTQFASGSYVKGSTESIFGRLNYDFANKYFVQATVRRDGLSSLGSDNRYGNFPGISFGWRPSQEKFWHSKFFNDLKLKGSYAIVGNPIGGFRYLSTFGLSPYGNIGGISISNVGNPDLKWERSKKTDFGFELTFFKNRANLTVDYFKNDIDQIILAVPTPQSAGIPGNSILKNIGTAINKGIEIGLNVDLVKKKDFNWNINFNYTNIINKVTSLYPISGTPATDITNPNSSPYNIIRVGQPIFALYGYRYAGVNAANGNPCYYKADNSLVQRNVATGNYYYLLSMNDPNIGVQTTLTSADKVVLGSVNPTYFGAFTNTFSYKEFSLEVMFRYSGGNKIMNVTRQEVLLNQKFANNGTEILNRWTKPGDITTTPKLYYANDAIINQNGEATSRFVEDGSFVKLQNIVLDYRFNKETLAHFHDYIKSIRVFVQAQNVATWTKYKGPDPEGYSNLGVDATVSPAIRTFSAGFNIGF